MTLFKPFQVMHDKVTSSVYHNRMVRMGKLLEDFLGINHFWYLKVTNSGHYSYLGTNGLWNEYFYSQNLFEKHPHLRHPDTLTDGISLIKDSCKGFDPELIDIAEKFGINFHVQLLKKNPEFTEGYGFATHSKLHIRDQLILNELPLLKKFITRFREENNHLFKIIDDSQVDLASHIGNPFYADNLKLVCPKNKKEAFLRNIGFGELLSLSSQEKEILKWVANGFPALYIANQLGLSRRTVEHYIDNVKNKLRIESRVELIEKAKASVDILYPHLDF